MKNIIRGSFSLLRNKSEKLRYFGSSGDGVLDSSVARLIIEQYDARREAFDRALAHPFPGEAIRTEARQAGIPLVTFLYGVPECLAQVVEPATANTIVLGARLRHMEPEVLAEILTVTDRLPESPESYLAIDDRLPDVFRYLARQVVGMAESYELLKVGISAKLLRSFTHEQQYALMAAIIRGVPAKYAAEGLRVLTFEEVMESHEAGLPLEYATLVKEATL